MKVILCCEKTITSRTCFKIDAVHIPSGQSNKNFRKLSHSYCKLKDETVRK